MWLEPLPPAPSVVDFVQTPDLLVVRFPTTGGRALASQLLGVALVALVFASSGVVCVGPREPGVAFALVVGATAVLVIGRWRQVAVRQTILTASPQECSIAQHGALHTFRWDELLAVHDRPYVASQGEHEAEVMSQVRLEVRPGMFVRGGRTLIVAEGHDDATRAWLAGALEAARARATRGGIQRRTDSVRPASSVEEPEGSRG